MHHLRSYRLWLKASQDGEKTQKSEGEAGQAAGDGLEAAGKLRSSESKGAPKLKYRCVSLTRILSMHSLSRDLDTFATSDFLPSETRSYDEVLRESIFEPLSIFPHLRLRQ